MVAWGICNCLIREWPQWLELEGHVISPLFRTDSVLAIPLGLPYRARTDGGARALDVGNPPANPVPSFGTITTTETRSSSPFPVVIATFLIRFYRLSHN